MDHHYFFKWNAKSLTKSSRKIANFIEINLDRLPFLTEQNIADELNISISTVSRFWRTVGYKNLKEFKQTLLQRNTASPSVKMKNVLEKVKGDDYLEKTIKMSIDHLNKTLDLLSRQEFQLAINALRTAQKTYIFAPRQTHGLAMLLLYRLRRYGLQITIMEGGRQLFESLMHIERHDLILAFGFSFVSAEHEVLVDFAQSRGCKFVIITDLYDTELINRVDIVLRVYRGQPWEFHSMIAPIAIVESLIFGIGRIDTKSSMDKLEQLNKLRQKYQHLIDS